MERMEEVGQSCYCICWDKLINMCLHLLSTKEKEVVVQCMRCFSSLGWFASVDIASWAAMEVAHISSNLTVLYMAIFQTYHVKKFSRERASWLFVLFFLVLYHCFFVQLPAAFVLPSREALCLGDRVVMYLPRCADTNSEVRKVSAEVSG